MNSTIRMTPKGCSRFKSKTQFAASSEKIELFLIEENTLLVDILHEVVKNYGNPHTLTWNEAVSRCSWKPDPAKSLFIVDEGSVPQISGQHLRLICHGSPRPRIILLSHQFTVDHILLLLLEGVSGFLTYKNAREELGAAIQTVMNGRLWLASEQLESLCLHIQKTWGAKTELEITFTKRQQQVIEMVQQKRTNKEIASALNISENTVKFHLAKIFSKLGTRNRSSLIEIAKVVGL